MRRSPWGTDEAGSWQLGVHWAKVLPAYFGSLAGTLKKNEYDRAVAALLEDFGRTIGSSVVDLRALAADAWHGRMGARARPGDGQAGSAPSSTRTHTSDDDIVLEKPLELIVVATKRTAARCRVLGSSQAITLRASMDGLVPGQIVAVEPNKYWRHRGHPYLAGNVTATRIDAAALGLTPLALHEFGEWNPAQEYWGEEKNVLTALQEPL